MLTRYRCARHLSEPLLQACAAQPQRASHTHQQEHPANQKYEAGNKVLAGQTSPPRGTLQRILRADLAAEEAAAALYRGQQHVLGPRPDLATLQEREEQHAAALKSLAPTFRTRPSVLMPALRAVFWLLGAATAAAPRPLAAAVAAGLADALTDSCNEQLRQMREEGLADVAPGVRHAVRSIRDEPRQVEGAPTVPDVLALQRLNELSPPELVAAAVKLGSSAAFGLAARV